MQSLKPGFVIGLFGARRTGKTVLMHHIKDQLVNRKVLMVNGENLDVAEVLSSRRLSLLQQLVAGYEYLFVDEAQQIPTIGLNLKLLVDSFPDLSIFVTGSSAFGLKAEIGEPLTGRGIFFNLFPIAELELEQDFLTAKEKLPERLIYGCYPQVITASSADERMDHLESIRNGALLKDILMLDNVKDSIFLINLLRALAFQIGNDVSHHELSRHLGVSKNTVARYIDLLEKTFVIFSLGGLSRNLRNEISKSRRYYFWDNGIRNAVISNYNRIELRDDTGRLWENYCLSERLKRNHYTRYRPNYYFWRTYQQQEIDLVEEFNNKFQAFEFKYSPREYVPPKAFTENYPGSDFQLIHREDYLGFIGK
jgi:hypothetical protein